MQLTIIIVNYNVQYFLEQCLLSVRKATESIPPKWGGQGGAETYVVDNNSVDGSVEMVREKFPEIKLIANQKNTGFAVANNQAMRVAKGKYILLLNPDTVVREDTFHKCLKFMEAHPEAGGLGVKMIDGSGNFLPESKRGFPSPFVAFCKTFGLSSLFPKSKTFNRYHLGFLHKDETHEVDVLAGAFMLMRKKTLDEVGLLDEAFFMYGEDIDLSYRIVLGGYKNYYLADTTIIHYKGESTKKGSLNYVRTFYQAMIIFAKKHFTGRQAKIFVAVLYMAIWLRAGMTLVGNFFQKSALPILDIILLFGGLIGLKYFWARYYYDDPGYYDPTFVWFNIPLYIIIWLGSVFFTGGYDERYNLRRLVRGLFIGTVLLSAIYGFLPSELRPSRAIVLLGAVWAVCGMVGLRTLIHFFREGNLKVGMSRPNNIIIVGSEKESERVQNLLGKTEVRKNYIGVVSPNPQSPITLSAEQAGNHQFLAPLEKLDEVVQIFKIDEIIFCSRDISSEKIMHWMSKLGPAVDYKIVPKESISIIGSSSKDAAGELYTIDVRYQIASPMNRRNKIILDWGFSFVFLVLFIPLFFIVKKPVAFLRNIWQVFMGKKSWVGYSVGSRQSAVGSTAAGAHILPKIKPGVLCPPDAIGLRQLDSMTVRRLNFLYAKDYEIWRDVEIIWKGLRKLGQ